MSLRARLALAAVIAVMVSVGLTSVAVLVSSGRTLRSEVDDSLRSRLEVVSAPLRGGGREPEPSIRLPRLGAAGGHTQLISRFGVVRVVAGDDEAIPPSTAAIALAARGGPDLLETVEVEGLNVRVLTSAWRVGSAVQVARPLDELESSLARLRRLLVGIMIGAGALAGLVALGLVRTALRPLHALSGTVERISRTGDLTTRVEVTGRDELGRLAISFNGMLAALEEALSAQRTLIADVSHELRTPLTSLRTNIEVLRRADGLSAEDQDRLTRDIDMQIAELSELIRDVIDLGRDRARGPVPESVELDEIVAIAVEQARTHWPEVVFRTRLESSAVQGDQEMIARAVGNLVDNAAKHGGNEVVVVVHDGEITVQDDGPGIAPADLPHVFDRFWRAPSARAKTGSGLGLAIVAQVARAHGGSVTVDSTPSRTTFRLKLGGGPVSGPEDPSSGSVATGRGFA